MNSSPNSPSATISAAMMPNRNERIRSSPRSTSATLPASTRRCSTTTNAATSVTPPTSANGTGEAAPESRCHHP